MSLRRRSCDACFKSRRKCDYGHPSCSTCQRTRKTCRYVYQPLSPSSTTSVQDLSPLPAELDAATGLPGAFDTSVISLIDNTDENIPETSFFGTKSLSDISLGRLQQLPRNEAMPPLSPRFLQSISGQPYLRLVGSLGEVQPVEGSNESWQWVMDQLKSYPREFAHRAQTLFIHPDLYRGSMPKPIRTAFGLSSAFCLTNETNSSMMFRAVDSEVVDLLNDCEWEMSLLDELATIQALVLYQTIRLFYGGLEQRVLAEQQQTVIMMSALKLLVRSQAELHDAEAVCWHSWIIAECVRRTAFVVYILYGVNSIFRQGICIGFHTLASLPMSTALTCWNSEADHLHQSDPGSTITYEMFTEGWLSMPRKLDPFEKFLLVACRGIDITRAFDDTGAVSPS